MVSQILIVMVLLLLTAGLANSRRLMQVNLAAYGLFLGAVYFIFFPALVFLLTGTLSVPLLAWINIDEQDLNLAILLAYTVGLGIIFLISALGRERQPVQLERNGRVDTSPEVKIYIISILCYFSMSLYILVASGVTAGGHWYLAKADYLEASGTLGVISLYSIWGLRLLIVSLTFELLTRKSITFLLAIAVTSLVCVYELLYVGNRIVVLMFGVAGFIYIHTRYGLRTLLLTILAISPIALGLAVYQDVRYMLFSATPTQILVAILDILGTGQSLVGEEALLSVLKVFEHADFVVMLNLFGMTGNTIDLLNGSTLLKTVVWFIPRSIWAEKPDSITVVVGQIFLPGSRVSLVPLVFGEFHVNFGMFGIVFFPFFMLSVLGLIKLITKRIPLHNYMNFLAGFLLFRLPISDIVISIMIAFAIYQLFAFVVKPRRRAVPREAPRDLVLKKQTLE